MRNLACSLTHSQIPLADPPRVACISVCSSSLLFAYEAHSTPSFYANVPDPPASVASAPHNSSPVPPAAAQVYANVATDSTSNVDPTPQRPQPRQRPQHAAAELYSNAGVPVSSPEYNRVVQTPSPAPAYAPLSAFKAAAESEPSAELVPAALARFESAPALALPLGDHSVPIRSNLPSPPPCWSGEGVVASRHTRIARPAVGSQPFQCNFCHRVGAHVWLCDLHQVRACVNCTPPPAYDKRVRTSLRAAVCVLLCFVVFCCVLLCWLCVCLLCWLVLVVCVVRVGCVWLV